MGRSCGGMVLGVKYDILDDDTLFATQVHINDQSVVGSQIFAVLYELDANNNKIYLTQSNSYFIQSSDLGNWTNIPFNNPYLLNSGTSYLMGVGGYASPTDTNFINISSNWATGQTAFIQDNGCNIGQGGFGHWYWLSKYL